MRRRVALLLALVAPLAQGSPVEGGPLDGDAAEYTLATPRDDRRVILAWSSEDVWLPTGETRRLATLSAFLLHAPEDAASTQPSLLNPFVDTGIPPDDMGLVRLHFADAAGDSLAWSVGWLDTSDGDRRWATRTTLGSCAAPAWILAWADPACPANTTIHAAARGGLPRRVDGDGWSLVLEAERRGREPLPVARAPLAEPIRAPLVEWTAQGPSKGDLRDHAFADARRTTLAQSPAAARFMVEHPDARPLYARHTWTTTAAPQDDPWRARLRGVPCTLAPAERAPGSEWDLAWVGARGSLFALVTRLGGAPGLDRLADASIDSYSTRNVGIPSTRAPSPRSLEEHLSLIPTAHGDVATLTIDLHPTGGLASIARGTCTRDARTDRLHYTGAAILFTEGEARSALTLAAERDAPSFLAIAHGAPPASGILAPTAPRGLEPAPTAAIAGALVAFVLGLLLYSRIRRDRVLDHAKRGRVHAEVLASPGRTIQEIARTLGLPRNTVEHHVRTLARNGYLDVRPGAHGLSLHPAGSRPPDHERLLQREHVAAILDIVAREPGIPQRDLALRVGMRKGHLSALAQELEVAGFLRRSRQGRTLLVHRAEGSCRSPEST